MDCTGSWIDRRRFLHLAAAAAAVPALPAHGQSGARGRPLVFALFPARSDAAKLLADWSKLFALLSRAIDRPVEGVVRDEAAIVAGLKAGEIHLAWIGNVPALDIVESGAGSVFARIVSESGSDQYSSVLVAPLAGQVASLADVLRLGPKLDVAFGDSKSFSGYAVPRYYALVRSGIKQEPVRFFKSVRNGSHRQNMEAAAAGGVQLATSNSDELRLFAERNPQAMRQLRTVWTSPPIPQSPLIWSQALGPEQRARIGRFFWQMNSSAPGVAEALQAVKLAGFRKSANKQLVPIQQVQMYLDMELAMHSVSAGEQQRTRLDEIAKRGSRLELKLKFEGGTF